VAGEGDQRGTASNESNQGRWEIPVWTGRSGNRAFPEASATVSGAARTSWKAGRDSEAERRVYPLEGRLPELFERNPPLIRLVSEQERLRRHCLTNPKVQGIKRSRKERLSVRVPSC